MAADSETTDDAELQEEVIAPALRRRLQQCYDHGQKLFEQDKYDHDYANTLFSECVANDPGNLVYVEAFLENLQRKYDNNKKGGRVKGAVPKGALKKAASKKDWKEVFKLGPEVLRANPWDVPALRAMAEACETFCYNEVELRYLKNALDGNPKDADVNRHCGQALARMGQFDQAIACWHRVEELKKNDMEATKMVSQLTTDKTRVQAGLAPSTPIVRSKSKTGRPDAASDSEEESKDTEQRREIPLTERQQLERDINDDPTDVAKIRRLAKLLVEEERYADAEQVLTKGLTAAGKDLQMEEELENVQLERARHQLKIAEKRAGIEQTAEASSLVEKLKKDLNRSEVEILGRRAERYPDNIDYVYQLGASLRRSGNYAEAIKCYQTAREDATLKAKATLEMGECLQRLKQFSKALQCYTWVAEIAADDEQLHLALYRAGVLATGMKKLDVAEQHLVKLAEIAPDYKDIQDRLDKVRQIRDKG